MSERKFKSNSIRWLFLGLAGTGLVHFSVSVLLWCIGIYAGLRNGHVTWSAFIYQAIAAFVLYSAFLAAFVFAWRFRVFAAPLTIISILAAVLCFGYDTRHHNYQISAMYVDKGCVHTYFTWWWYDDIHDPNR